MSLYATTVEVSTDISLRVPRGTAGDLPSGVADVLDAIDAVQSVTVERVTSVRPAYTDIHVDADVALVCAVPEDADAGAATERRLADGFGVTGVNELRVD